MLHVPDKPDEEEGEDDGQGDGAPDKYRVLLHKQSYDT